MLIRTLAGTLALACATLAHAALIRASVFLDSEGVKVDSTSRATT